MSTKRRRKGRLPPFIPLIKSTMAMPAWRAMSPGARLLYIEVRGWLRNDYSNNGKVYQSCRKAADAIGAAPRSIVRWFAENEHYGFLRRASEGFLGSDGHGIAASFRLTEFPCGTHPPTRDFEKWDGELFVYTSRRPRRKKQNPGSLVNTPRVPGEHIRKGFDGGSVCVPGEHIGKPPRCVPDEHISRLATPKERRGNNVGHQGSSMARAPAQAGDAGSSPAPEATRPYRHSQEGLTEIVLAIVHEQLNEFGRMKVGDGWIDWPVTSDEELARLEWLPTELRMMAAGLTP
jgi:hypothetical protein